MNKWWLILSASIILACNKIVDSTPGHQPKPDPEKPSAFNSFKQYTILKGNHFAEGNDYKKLNQKELRFLAIFDSTCIYKNSIVLNQLDINKLYGFSDCDTEHHTNSARFGWRWNGSAIEIHAYCYVDSIRFTKFLGEVLIGQSNAFSLKILEHQYEFDLNGHSAIMERNCKGELINGYQLYPYFGGDEPAPHDINIYIKEY